MWKRTYSTIRLSTPILSKNDQDELVDAIDCAVNERGLDLRVFGNEQATPRGHDRGRDERRLLGMVSRHAAGDQALGKSIALRLAARQSYAMGVGAGQAGAREEPPQRAAPRATGSQATSSTSGATRVRSARPGSTGARTGDGDQLHDPRAGVPLVPGRRDPMQLEAAPRGDERRDDGGADAWPRAGFSPSATRRGSPRATPGGGHPQKDPNPPSQNVKVYPEQVSKYPIQNGRRFQTRSSRSPGEARLPLLRLPPRGASLSPARR